MSVYYQDELVTLYHGDCRDVLPVAADVVITDPPYAVRWSKAIKTDGSPRKVEMLGYVSPNWSEKATHSRGYADHDSEAFAEFLGDVWPRVKNSLPPGAPVISFCGNRTFHEMFTAASASGLAVLDVLVFVSPHGVAKSTTTLMPGHELAALLRTPGKPKHINPTWKLGNVYQISKSRHSESEHLTTKPVRWMRQIIGDFTTADEVVLDPFCGSGSTLRAAKDLGRRSVGVEIDERYCEIAATRLAQDVLDFGGAA